MRFLTPNLRSNSSTSATRDRSICRSDTFRSPGPTDDVGGLRRPLEHVIAVSDPVDVATPLATSAETVMVVSAPGEACCTAAFAEPPPITLASRR